MAYTVTEEMLDEAMDRFGNGEDETWREGMRAVLQLAMDRRDRESASAGWSTGNITLTDNRYSTTAPRYYYDMMGKAVAMPAPAPPPPPRPDVSEVMKRVTSG